jgi:hypothetical protein
VRPETGLQTIKYKAARPPSRTDCFLSSHTREVVRVSSALHDLAGTRGTDLPFPRMDYSFNFTALSGTHPAPASSIQTDALSITIISGAMPEDIAADGKEALPSVGRSLLLFAQGLTMFDSVSLHSLLRSVWTGTSRGRWNVFSSQNNMVYVA